MKKNLDLLLFAFVFFISAKIVTEKKITIAVAANAQYAMEEIKIEFEKETGIKIEIIKGASGKLTAQIKEGAPYDIFLSADTSYPNNLHREGLVEGNPKIYGYGTLVLWTIKDFDLNVNVVLTKEIKQIAIANPKLAPYGLAAVDALRYYNIYDKAESKLVYGESLSQVNQFVISGAADIGFTSKSLVLAKEMQGKGKWMEVSKEAYVPIAQSAVLLKSASQRDGTEAKKFFDYLYSTKAKNIFKKYGYEMQ